MCQYSGLKWRFLLNLLIPTSHTFEGSSEEFHSLTRIDVYETLCPQQMLVHKGGKIKNWGGECRDVTPTNCSLKIYLKRALGGGGGGVGWRDQDGCE